MNSPTVKREAQKTDAQKLLALAVLRQKYRDAQGVYYKAFHKAFPVGSHITWEKGGHLQDGVIERSGYYDDVFVKNSRTGKVVKVSYYYMEKAR